MARFRYIKKEYSVIYIKYYSISNSKIFKSYIDKFYC